MVAVALGVRRDVTEPIEVDRRRSRGCLGPGALACENDVAAHVVIGTGGLRVGFRRVESEESVRPAPKMRLTHAV